MIVDESEKSGLFDRSPIIHPHQLFRSARPPVRAKNLIQLYSYINYHRTAINLSDIVCCMSGGVWSMSDGVNVYRLK